eukprot:NODE_5735_length_914_cov_136.032870_g5511_i0.p1 GENE.NODE_5735_length_914_cov_136.032870_g5511_i0~~NODE_5735_length_914_cov_136.032870_g5511_i0.p1  ORF type:complete len:252 (+),score=35.51 NODE_5735_length_914_cov_136.032870_g5511_i0:119-874(+)
MKALEKQFTASKGGMEVFLRTLLEEGIDLETMRGYSMAQLVEVVADHAVLTGNEIFKHKQLLLLARALHRYCAPTPSPHSYYTAHATAARTPPEVVRNDPIQGEAEDQDHVRLSQLLQGPPVIVRRCGQPAKPYLLRRQFSRLSELKLRPDATLMNQAQDVVKLRESGADLKTTVDLEAPLPEPSIPDYSRTPRRPATDPYPDMEPEPLVEYPTLKEVAPPAEPEVEPEEPFVLEPPTCLCGALIRISRDD